MTDLRVVGSGVATKRCGRVMQKPPLKVGSLLLEACSDTLLIRS
jgi:hypothetical protein